MDRLIPREEAEKARRKKVFWLSVVMLFLLVASTGGYAFLSGGHSGVTGATVDSSSGIPYEQQNIDYADVLGIDENITSIPVDLIARQGSYAGASVYIDANDTEALTLIASAFQGYASVIRQGCFGACEEDLPEKDCTSNIIVYREGETQRVYQNESCIFIEGDLDSARAFVYKLSGII